MTRSFIVAGFLAAAMLLGCGIPEEEYNAKVKEVEKLKGDLSAAAKANKDLESKMFDMRAENQKLAKRLQELGDDVENLLGEKSQLSQDLKQTRDREARLRREQEAQSARMAKYRQVIEKFKSLISSGKLKIRIVKGQMVVELASSILFESGKATLSEEGEGALSQLASILNTISDRSFQVAGHTDNVPIKSKKFPSNWELSADRAVTVVRFLQEQGVNPSNLSAAGHAEYQPTASNDNEDGRAANRRIEIVLLPNLDELPDLSDLEGDLGAKK